MNFRPRSIRSDDRDLEARIGALAPRFHNINLGRIWTVPDHSLGD